MFLISLFALQVLIATSIHCAAQEAFKDRDARSRQREINVRDQMDDTELDTTAFLQGPQHPSHFIFGGNSKQINYKLQQQYPLAYRNTPSNVAKYRNLGNYYQNTPLIASQQSDLALSTSNNNKMEHKPDAEYNINNNNTPIRFDNHVLHMSYNRDIPDKQEKCSRRYTNAGTIATQAGRDQDNERKRVQDKNLELPYSQNDGGNNEDPTTIKESKSYHDIFVRFNRPNQMSFGHIELNPDKLFQKRFESLNNSNKNHHRGEIVWKDAQGGYGEHHWDLLQGRLS